MRTIKVGTKSETKVAGTGDIEIKVSVDVKPFIIRLMNALHVPDIVYLLLSVSQMSNKGFNVKLYDGRCHTSSELFSTSCTPIFFVRSTSCL